MRMLNGLLALFLFALPAVAQNKVKGLTLPAPIQVSASDLQKRVIPVFDDPSKVIDCKFLVLSSGKSQPNFKTTGTGASTVLELYVPPQGETYFIFGYALYAGDKPWMTDLGRTFMAWGPETLPPPVTPPVKPPTDPPVTPPTDPPVTPPTTDVDAVFKSVKKIHALFIFDQKALPVDVAKVTQYETTFRKHFEQPGTDNHWWQYDWRTVQKAVQAKLVDAQGKPVVSLPVVVLINGGTTPATIIGNPIPITVTGDTAKSVTSILTTIAGALKK